MALSEAFQVFLEQAFGLGVVGLMLAFTAFMASTLYRLYSDVQSSKDLTRRIATGLRLGTIKDLGGVELLARALFGDRSENERRALMNVALLRGQSWLHRQDRRLLFFGRELPDDEIRDLYGKFTALIAENDEEAPFAKLPAEERAILTDAKLFLEAGKGEAVQEKLVSLAGVIEAKDKTVRQFVRIRRWTVAIGVIGLIYTAITTWMNIASA